MTTYRKGRTSDQLDGAALPADAQTSAATSDQDDRLPDAVLERMPELIFDSFRKLLWQLEVDGMYGLEADGHHATGYIRRSLDELRANGGQLVALIRDSRARGGDGLLALDQNRTSA